MTHSTTHDDSQAEIIEVSEQTIEEVTATQAHIFVTISGEKLFAGSAALEKAKEVRRLCEQLEAKGVEPTDIDLVGVQAQVSSGILGRYSSATYTLRVLCEDLTRLPELFEVVTQQKKCTLRNLEWVFEADDGLKARWLGDCIGRTRTKADAMARALGGRVAGLQRCREHTLGERRVDPDLTTVTYFAEAQAACRKSALSGGIAGHMDTAELAPSRTMGVRVEVAYRFAAA